MTLAFGLQRPGRRQPRSVPHRLHTRSTTSGKRRQPL